MRTDFSKKEARTIIKKIGTKLNTHGLDQFKKGLKVELEHGKDAEREGVNANLTNDDPVKTGKIALAHINEHPNYYTGLDKMESKEEEAEKKGRLKSIVKKNIKK